MNQEEYRDRQSRQKSNLAMVYNITMGLVILLVGVYFFTLKQGHGFKFVEDVNVRYAFATLCVLYGGFRLFRGLKTTNNQ